MAVFCILVNLPMYFVVLFGPGSPMATNVVLCVVVLGVKRFSIS